MANGIYISVPFCRTKCSYCNFASDVFSRGVFAKYVEKLCADIHRAPGTAADMGGEFDRQADSIYFGGGTPTVLGPAELERIFAAVWDTFEVPPGAEITMECAPGMLNDNLLDTLLRCGVNRVSLGVQSFVDAEAAAVGRLHTRAATLADVARLRAAGIANLSIDLIAGLPHQNAGSWRESLDCLVELGLPHASVYMLEVDEDSRLGRELIAGGTRYHAHFVPDEEAIADFYQQACERLEAAGIRQYEISNFARERCQSRHNLKYWTRQPYLGFGVDAHSMLPAASDSYVLLRSGEPLPGAKDDGCAALNETTGADFAGGSRPCAVTAADLDAVRFATPDSLEAYIGGAPLTRTPVTLDAAREECFFLGLRLNAGVELKQVALQYGLGAHVQRDVSELYELGLLEYDREREIVRLTADGRLLSNEVFERFLAK